MQVRVQEGVDADYFRRQAEAVAEKLAGEEDIAFLILAIEDPKQCGALLDDVHIADREAFQQNCEQALTSMSYRAEGQEIIVIKADKDFLFDNPAALRGLIAHEMMHTVQRHSGIEDTIREASEAHINRAVADLQDRGYDKQEIAAFLQTVMSTAIFALKDIYANTQLIEQGFAHELEQYYHHMLDVDEYCDVPSFYGDEATLQEVQEALQFELGLLPAWLPFNALDREEADAIKERITTCYERDIPDVARTVHAVTDLYHDMYDDHDRFNDAFFDTLLTGIYDMLDEKLDRA